MISYVHPNRTTSVRVVEPVSYNHPKRPPVTKVQRTESSSIRLVKGQSVVISRGNG